MKHVKTRLRASLSDSRLSSLALIAVERQLSHGQIMNSSKVIDVFATQGSRKRRLDFLL